VRLLAVGAPEGRAERELARTDVDLFAESVS